MFRFTKKQSSGSHSQYYATIALTTSARRLSQLWTTSCNFS